MIPRRRASIMPTSRRVSSGGGLAVMTTCEGCNAILSSIDLHLCGESQASDRPAKYCGKLVLQPQEGRLDPAIRRQGENDRHHKSQSFGRQQLPSPDWVEQAQHDEDSGEVQHIEPITDLAQA